MAVPEGLYRHIFPISTGGRPITTQDVKVHTAGTCRGVNRRKTNSHVLSVENRVKRAHEGVP